MDQFEALDYLIYYLLIKFPKIRASQQWQTIVCYYEDIKQELESQK